MRTLALAVLVASSLPASARDYIYEEIANNPFQLDGKTIKAEGQVQRLKYRKTSRWGYWTFQLTEPDSKRYVAVTYYVLACGRSIDALSVSEGDTVAVTGRFQRLSMKKVTRFLGNLKANEEKRDAACREDSERRRKR